MSLVDFYTVERHTHGVLVTGRIPIADLVGLTKAWAEDSEENWFLDCLIAEHFHATVCTGLRADLAAWRAELGLPALDLPTAEPPTPTDQHP